MGWGCKGISLEYFCDIGTLLIVLCCNASTFCTQSSLVDLKGNITI